jgi:hypothetical protein
LTLALVKPKYKITNVHSFGCCTFQPRWLLSEQHWSEVTGIGFSFMSNSEHVSAVKCGVSLVYQENMEEFTRTYVQLMTSFADFAKDIRSRMSLPPPGEQMQYEEHPQPHKTGPLVRLVLIMIRTGHHNHDNHASL